MQVISPTERQYLELGAFEVTNSGQTFQPKYRFRCALVDARNIYANLYCSKDLELKKQYYKLDQVTFLDQLSSGNDFRNRQFKFIARGGQTIVAQK